MKYLLVVFMLFFTSIAFAEGTVETLTEFEKLTPLQKAEILKTVAATAERNEEAEQSAQSVVTPEKVESWVSSGTKIGKEFGDAIVSLAKELGIAANEFVKTPVGVITVGLIVWHVAGDSLGVMLWDLLTSGIWFITMIPLWFYLLLKICRPVTEYREVNKITWYGKEYKTNVPIKRFQFDENSAGAFIISAVVIVLVGLILLG